VRVEPVLPLICERRRGNLHFAMAARRISNTPPIITQRLYPLNAPSMARNTAPAPHAIRTMRRTEIPLFGLLAVAVLAVN